MRMIRATLQDEDGIQTHNVKVLVMTDEDAQRLLETQAADVEVHTAVAMRFKILEEQIMNLREQVTLIKRAINLR